MSDKPRHLLNELDILVRDTIKTGMDEGVLLKIEFISGFELFNTRRYHNYETWSQGWRVSGQGATVEKEDLDDAIKAWVAAPRDITEPKGPSITVHATMSDEDNKEEL